MDYEDAPAFVPRAEKRRKAFFLEWARSKVSYVKIEDLSSAWADGIALSALIDAACALLFSHCFSRTNKSECTNVQY